MNPGRNNILTLCEPIAEFVCTHESCNSVVEIDCVISHLKRKHKWPASDAKKEAEKLSQVRKSAKRVSYWERYFDCPFPDKDDVPLPQLPALKVRSVVKCPLCSKYYGPFQSCRTHINRDHARDARSASARNSLPTSKVHNGQTLFTEPRTKFFPVISSSSQANESQHVHKILASSRMMTPHTGNEIVAMEDRAMNAAASILNLPDFMKSKGLTCEKSYSLTTFRSSHDHSAVLCFVTAYMDFFCKRDDPISQCLVDMVRIRNVEAEANFSLKIQKKSREGYARSFSRFIIASSNIDESGITHSRATTDIKQAANDILSNLSSRGKGSEDLPRLHRFLRLLFLEDVKGSQGERVLLEDLFKLVLSGYSSSQQCRARVGYAEDASHLCASLQFICQMTALGEFLLPPTGFGDTSIHGVATERERREFIQAKLSTDSCTSAAFIRSTLHRTKRLSHGEAPHITFAPCYSHPYCGVVDNLEVQMNSEEKGSLGFAVRSIQREARDLPEDKILRRFRIPESTWVKALSFADRISCKDAGYFFGGHKDSQPVMNMWSESFANYLTEGEAPIIQKSGPGRNQKWQHSPLSTKWLQSCDRFMKYLYLLIHLCGGGPPRVTEMVNAKLKNTATGRRSVILYKGRIAVLVSYSKTQAQFEKPKPIARFLDNETMKLLLSYVIFVKPVQVFLMESCFGQGWGTEEYLFTRHGDVLSEDEVYPFFRNTMKAKGTPFTVSLYRHYRTGTVKTYMSNYTSVTGENAALLQSGHSEQTAYNCYAANDFDFSTFTTPVLESYLSVSLKWHELLGLTSNIDGYHLRLDLKIGETDHVPRSIQGRIPAERKQELGGNLANRSIPRQHEGKLITSGTGDVTKKRARLHASDDGAEMPKRLKNSEYHLADPDRVLAKFMRRDRSEKVNFKSKEQRAATLECQTHPFSGNYRSSLFLNLPTGGGKTVCWAAPALEEQTWYLANRQDMRITILIVPLIALQQDQLLRLREKGLNASLWGQRNEPGVSVVICSVDVVGTSDFEMFVTQKAQRGLITRFVIDEVHLLVLWEHFRDFSRIKKGLSYEGVEIPLVLLSATMPPSLIAPIRDVLCIQDTCVKMIRAPVGRPNIKYDVIHSNATGSKVIDEGVSYMVNAFSEVEANERLIVFCLTIEDAEMMRDALAKSLKREDCVHLYHGSLSLEEKNNSFEKWLAGNGPQVMVATAAFSCGIDCRSVRTCLHLGGCGSLVAFAQETGRVGRDGEASKSVVLYSSKFFQGRILQRSLKYSSSNQGHLRKRVVADGNEMRILRDFFGKFEEFIYCTEGCRRAVLENYIDGVQRGRCTDAEENCDLCSCSSPIQSTGDKQGGVIGGTNVPALREPLTPDGDEVQRSEENDSFSKSIARVKRLGLPTSVDESYILEQLWKAKELSLLKCANCVVNRVFNQCERDHKSCVRARCFRCMEYPAYHQSRDCEVVPRTETGKPRCYFCGISKNANCHPPDSYDRRSCPWLIVKNISMLLWQDPKEQPKLLMALPSLLPCETLRDVCYTFCGGAEENEWPLLFVAVDLLHDRYVLRPHE